MDRTVERVNKAIQNGEQILIFGDYDADGVSSTTVLYLALQELGADVEFYIPNRFTEGYKTKKHSVGRIAQDSHLLLLLILVSQLYMKRK